MRKDVEELRNLIQQEVSNLKQELIVCKTELVRHEETTKRAIKRVDSLVKKSDLIKRYINQLINKLVRLIR